jgi:hypothetical protein
LRVKALGELRFLSRNSLERITFLRDAIILILPRFSGHLERPQVNIRGRGGVHEKEPKEI